ncbi:MAG: hypothetical protein PVJ57_12690 [Phycisphaerae bacterium]|jgi:hypothetical protein
MNGWFCWLMAAGGREDVLQGLRSGLTEKSNNNDLILALAAVAALSILLLVLRRFLGRHGRPAAAPPAVDALGVVMKILDLPRAAQDDLRRLATYCRLSEPAAMLLSPVNLARAYERGFAKLGDPDLRHRLDALCQQTFGQPLPVQSDALAPRR